jgi:RNA polymerase sigma-70 factor (ECF subfamily)
MADPDLQLVKAMANGDVRALDELYVRHGRGILSYLIGLLDNRELAEEVLQDVMLAAWRGAGQFRGESQVRTWLLAIARLQALNALRGRKFAPIPLNENIAGDDTGQFRMVEFRSEQEAIRAALHQLPRDQKETLELIFYHELSGVEAAEILGVAPGTIKSRVNRAKATLRRILQRKEVDHES